MKSSLSSLTAISPIDGRYRKFIEELSDYSSEFSLIKHRVEIEVRYLILLSKLGIIRKLSKKELGLLEEIYIEFDIQDAEENKKIANEYQKNTKSGTQHDLKAVEYYIRRKLDKTTLSDISEFIHFGLTSEDINNIAIRLMLKGALQQVIIKALIELNSEILNLSKKHNNLSIIGRTHGQAAVPTTLGKEFLVFYKRFENEIKILQSLKFSGKLNGAVGNYNSLSFTYPNINWKRVSKEFLLSFGLNTRQVTNQIAPYEDIVFFFQTIQRINGILLDLNQDMWRYISDGWFVQENIKDQIGSSTMPQKINPILFENSEGNIIIANALIESFSAKLPTSRLQRDLSGSTISRNFGVCLAYSLISYKNSLSALRKIKPNKIKISEELNSDWTVLSEAAQIYLKKHGVKNAYELIKDLTRGQKLDKNSWLELIDQLPIKEVDKKDLKNLTPEKYTGLRS